MSYQGRETVLAAIPVFWLGNRDIDFLTLPGLTVLKRVLSSTFSRRMLAFLSTEFLENAP
jgi:hypothetical protein